MRSPSTSTGVGGGSVRFGMVLGVCGSSMETWNTGCTDWSSSGSRNVKEWVPTWAMSSYGPRYFSASFLVGLQVRKYFL